MKKLILAVLLGLLPSLAWGAVYYATGAGAGAKDGALWASAMGEAEFEASIEGGGVQAVAAGDIYYVLGGETLTLDGAYDSSAQDGTVVAPISIIGVKAATTAEPPTYTDWPAVGSADRPTFVCAEDSITWGNYYKISNLIFTGSGAALIGSSGYDIWFNCKFYTTEDAGTGTTVTAGLSSGFLACEFEGDANGFNHMRGLITGSYCRVLFSYFHSLDTGVRTGSYTAVIGSIFDTIETAGVEDTATVNTLILNNTFYNSADGITSTTGSGTYINNIMDTISDNAFEASTQTDWSFFWMNHEGGSVTDMWDGVAETMPHMDPEVTSGDPKFTTPGSDFSLQSSSPCLDAGFSVTLGAE